MERVDSLGLGALQRRLWRLITEPGGVAAALAEENDEAGAGLAALVRGDDSLAASDRVAVYANAYFARIQDALRDDFGALALALGEAAFHDLVKTYLMMHPPTQPSLRHAGARLAEHLATEPFAEIFARRCPCAADLARLEWAMAEAFSAADAPVVARADLAAVATERWSELRFEPAPSLRLLSCGWPVQRARERFDRGDPGAIASPLDAEPTWLRVWRREEQVRYRAISRLEFEALRAAAAGESFAAICDRLASAIGEVDAAGPAASLLASWTSDQLLARLR